MSPSFVYIVYWYLHSRRECISSQQGERHRVQIEDLCDGCISLSHAEGCSGSVLFAFYKCSPYGNIAFGNQFYVITRYLREARTSISHLASYKLVFVAIFQILARHKLHFRSKQNNFHNSCHCRLYFYTFIKSYCYKLFGFYS